MDRALSDVQATLGGDLHPASDGGAIETVAIVGGDFMGTGIAESIAAAGLPVTVREIDEDRVGLARKRIAESLDRSIAGGKLVEEAGRSALALIKTTTSLEMAVGDADLVIEAVPENVDLKRKIVNEIDAHAPSDAIIASNTSSIPLAQLASEVHRPERMVGLHFFAPVPRMGLVEVVRALDTSDRVVAGVRAFAERIGKRPIETKDRSGFIVNMLLVPYLMAAVRMYEEGFASREDIDAGMRLGCGHPMGPLRLCDLIGLDVLDAVCESLFDEFKRHEYAAPPLLKRMLAGGRLGRKSGRGFYEYESGRAYQGG